MNKHYTARFDEINNATGFANGETYSNPQEVRDAFTVEVLADCFGGSVVAITGGDKAVIIGVQFSNGAPEMTEEEIESYVEDAGLCYYLQSTLTEWADDVIRNEWHCDFKA